MFLIKYFVLFMNILDEKKMMETHRTKKLIMRHKIRHLGPAVVDTFPSNLILGCLTLLPFNYHIR